MSDGMSDANAVGKLAVDLREAAYVLRDAIDAALNGHRGMSPPICETVNAILKTSGYHLTKNWEGM